MSRHRSPTPRVEVPVLRVECGRTAVTVQAVPELDAAGRVPASVDVQHDPQRVLERPGEAGRNEIGPAARPALLREVDVNAVLSEVEQLDRGSRSPARDV